MLTHEPGCLREKFRTEIQWAHGRIQVLPTYRQRWSCEACSLYKLLNKLEPIWAHVDDFAVGERHRTNVEPGERLCISFTESSRYLYVAEPQCLPREPVIDTLTMLGKVRKYITDIRRVTITPYWRSLSLPKKDIETVWTSIDREATKQAIENAGFFYGKFDKDMPRELVKRRLKSHLSYVDEDTPSWS